MDRKYGIKNLDLTEKYPDFITDNAAHTVRWLDAMPHITGRIQSFLILIARKRYKGFSCFCCSYPSKYASDYLVLVDIDNGEEFMIISTIKETGQYPSSTGKRIEGLTEELHLFDAPREQLINLRQEIADQLHPGE